VSGRIAYDLTRAYGLELTQKYIADGDHKSTENEFGPAHLDVIKTRECLFLGGKIDWLDKEYQSWNQVIIPLEKAGTV
jgi:hypothetical protein